jgi:hypothetical protein
MDNNDIISIKTKSDLVIAYKISRFTLGKYLNTGLLYEKLLKTGYHKKQVIITPLQLRNCV